MMPEDLATSSTIDRKVILCLTGDGPKYLDAELGKTSALRNVGCTYYDADFANVIFCEMIRCQGKAKMVATNLVHFFLSKGCRVVFLLPRQATTVYLKIMEELMDSPIVKHWLKTLATECIHHKEFTHVSTDVTARMAMRLKGQSTYREPKAVRNANVVGDDLAKRRILTIRGRTGGVLAMEPIKSESSEDVQNFLMSSITSEALGQIEYLATDQPSAVLFQHLSEVCSSLRAIYLDEVHLCIVWNVAFWRKSSLGQKALHRVQDKFNRVDYSTPLAHWGPLFTGREKVNHSQGQENVRALIMSGGMSVQRAASVLNSLQDSKPWFSKIDYIRALAAIAAAFPAEMARKTYSQGRTIAHILWCAAAPDKVAWMWNAIIVRRSLPQGWLTLLPAGTGSNESLHAELNRWWRNSPEQFPTTLQVHLAIGHLGKLLAHSAALYQPTLRQVGHDQVVALAVRAVTFTRRGSPGGKRTVAAVNCLCFPRGMP